MAQLTIKGRAHPGLPMDRVEAIKRGMWGLRWASIAEGAGSLIAAVEPLPDPEEAQAQSLADGLAAAAPGGSWSYDDNLVVAAIQAFAATIPVLRTAFSGRPVTPAEMRKMGQLLHAAEWAGRRAAIASRTLWHLQRISAGPK